MKNLYKIFIIIPFALCIKISAQEPVVFHFNFSFENTYISPNHWIPEEDIDKIAIKVLSPKGHVKWERNFTRTNLPRDQYGNCLLSDTIKNLKTSPKPYGLKINYLLTSGINDSCKLLFSYPDSVRVLALELYFDQAMISQTRKDSIDNITWEEYNVNPNPRPVLIVKFSEPPKGIYMSPTWFDYWRITRRPLYILYNNSTDTMFKADDGFLTCYFGYLQILDSTNQWNPYFFGGFCGTITCQDPIYPGQTFNIVEAYPIGDPIKLIGGYYKYSVEYKDSRGINKTVNTYFTVIYSTPN